MIWRDIIDKFHAFFWKNIYLGRAYENLTTYYLGSKYKAD